MPGLLNDNQTNALGMFGMGLLNMSQGKKATDFDPAFLTAMANRNQSNQFQGTNPNYQLPANPVDDSVSRLMSAIGHTESGNKYGAIGVPTKSGDRAYGQYQVMGANIPSWTKEVLGQEMTPQEFLSSPEAQDKVARAKLGAYLNQTGNIGDASSMWFSGRPMRNNMSKDILGTSVPDYVRMVQQNY